MVGQVCRFSPGFALAKKLIERGDIGELFFVESEYAHNYKGIEGVGNWRKDPKRHPFIGGACHAVDLLRWIAGDIKEVFAYSNHKCLLDWPYDDCTIAMLKFRNKIIGKVFCSIGCVRPYTMRSVFYGKEGTIIADNTSSHIQIASRDFSMDKHPSFAQIPVDVASHNISGEIDEFIDCIIKDKPVVMDAKEGTKTVAACIATINSVKEGKPLKVEKI